MAAINFSRAVATATATVRAILGARCLEALPVVCDSDASLDDEGAFGPGWFESSWDLRHGLDIREGAPKDASFHDWPELSLST